VVGVRTFRSLSFRLFVSYLAVVVVAIGVVFATTRLLAPTFFRVNLEATETAETSTTTLPAQSTTSATVDSPSTTGGVSPTVGPGGSPSTSQAGSTSTSQAGSTSTSQAGSTSTSQAGSTSTSQAGSTSTSGPGGSPSTSQAGGSSSGRESSGGAPAAGSSDGTHPVVALAGFLVPGEEIPDTEVNEAFLSAIDSALFLSLLVSLVVAGGFAAFVSQRIMRPIARVRATTVRLAEGHYGERVTIPDVEELADLARDVNGLAETLEVTEQRRNRLIADVAHELRTPLTTIQGYMEAFIDGVIEPSDELFSSVSEEAARLQRVVADLGLLSRLDEAVLEMKSEPVDVGELAAVVAERLLPQFLDKDVRLRTDTPAGFEVIGDRDRLAQVFTNLVGNALTHTGPSGRVAVTARSIGVWVEVEVADTGEGISPANVDQIFERFYRVDKGSHQGTGLGLTIARSIARAHGGDVVAHSEGIGKGSQFVVRLPELGDGVAAHEWLDRPGGPSPPTR